MTNPPPVAAVPQEEIAAIRARHELADNGDMEGEDWDTYVAFEDAHTDRGTLLALVDRLSAELAKERERRGEVKGEALHFRFSKNDHGLLLTFVEAENAEGYSVHVGEWSDDGQYSLLTIPNPYALRAEIARLTAALKDIDKCRRYYLQAETPEQRDMRADEFQRFVAGTVSATITKDTP